ncbi:glycosyltransferase family 4 protein [Agrococcus sediminis]|uniref:glycosyltransferase family 4 protein n=1 Tax=Agrococcus sediminis TaxID=2599924 RepID=UPI0037F6DB67
MLLLSHYFEPEHGAPQRRWRALIEQLTAMGCAVDVIAPVPHHPSGRAKDARYRAGNTELGAHGASVHRVSYLPHDGSLMRRTIDHMWVAMCSARRGSALIKRGSIGRPDVVVATAPALPTLAAGWWLAKRHAIPFVVEMRDAWPDLVSHTPGLHGSRSLKHELKRLVHRSVTAVQRSADAVVTTTEAFADVLRGRGIQHVEVIRNGTDPAAYEAVAPPEDLHRALRVLYMGTIGRSQGLDTVVRAVARLCEAGVRLDARIVGAGADHAQLRDLNRRLGSPVDVREAVLPEEVLAHYRWADTCVVSLRDWEPFRWTVPSKLYELMATGKHLTAILAGEGAAIVQKTDCGVVIAPGDVDGLVEAWALLERERDALLVSDAGQRWVREHVTYPRLADEYLRLFSAVVSRGRTSAPPARSA